MKSESILRNANRIGYFGMANYIKMLPFLIIFVSILLRFWMFWKPSLSGDEGEYAYKAVLVFNGIGNLILGRDTQDSIENVSYQFLQHAHGPLEFLVMVPLVPFYPHEFFVRAIFVTVGSAVLLLSFIFLRRLRDINVATVFVLVFGTSTYAIWWAQTAMYQSLSMASSIFVFLSMMYFLKKPSKPSLILLFLSPAVGLLVFPDFILFLPSIAWIVYDKRCFIKGRDLVLALGTFLLVSATYYLPWVMYRGNPNVGFSYLLSAKLSAEIDFSYNFRGFWHNFFSFPGVYSIWPLSLFSIFLVKRVAYVKYILFVVFFASTTYVFKAYVPYFYFVSIFALLAILASEVVASLKQYRYLAMCVILALNFFSIQSLIKGEHNPLIFGEKVQQADNAKQVGVLARRCLQGKYETYLSTYPTGKAAYYFGKWSTAYYDGSEFIPKIELFLDNRANTIKLIHYSRDYFVNNRGVEDHLNLKAFKVIKYKHDVVLLFKDCDP